MSWEQLIGVIEEAEQLAEPEPLIDCPECGITLESGPSGPFCRFDGWSEN